MKKKKLIILACILTFTLLCSVVYAAFVFQQNVALNATTGEITLDNKYFLDYSRDKDSVDLPKEEYRSSTPYEINAKETNSITCYATEKEGKADEDTSYCYLNQIGFKFSFTNTMDVYVRIHIQDSWVSRKIYNNGNIVENYITKDKIEGASPFKVTSNDWVFDETTNCAYLKTKVSPSESTEYIFNVNSTYFYESEDVNSYREQIVVQVSYIVDIVQANRAAKKWNVDLKNIIGS